MASATMPFVKPQWFTNAGVMASSYKLFTYDAGTTTKRATYSDSALTSANANPIVLDAFGRASVYLLPQLYKFVLAPPTDSDPPIAPIWTADNVPASATLFTNFDLSGTAGENITTNDVVYLSDGSGGNTAGRWYKADADFTYASTTAYEIGMALAAISTGNSGSIRQIGKMIGLSGLTAGAVYYVSATAGALTSTAPSNAIVVGKADTTTSLILDPSWGKASATVQGLVTLTAQSWAGQKTFNAQPLTYIGTASTLPASIGGTFFTDTAIHAAPQNSTNLVMSSTTIPANALNSDGKGVGVFLGSSTASTGANNKTLVVSFVGSGGGTAPNIFNTNLNETWWVKVYFVRRGTGVSMTVISGESINGIAGTVVAVAGPIDFSQAITLTSQANTGAASTMTQTYFTVRYLG